ncbi:MAG: sensor histidine kinase [Bacteroidota bacterium]|jgi:two-component system sensor histidine kinase CiaH
MLSSSHKKNSRQFTFLFWILLTYVIAALVWWFISLEKQNREMTDLRLSRIDQFEDRETNAAIILNQQKRNTTKYVAEGITFLVLILIGAYFVYRAIRRQMHYAAVQRNFMMAITHELKTPIAAARLSVETLLYRDLKPEQQKKFLHSALAETDRLNSLTSNILLAAQMEEKTYHASKENLDLSLLVNKVADDYTRRFPERKIQKQIEDRLMLHGDPVLLEMVFSNLIENALKYTPKDKPVLVVLKKENEQIVGMVYDEGPGIPDTEKEKIFEKFYRGGDEATRKTKGTGLGLYLARKITEAHQGTVFVKDHSPSGSIFVVQFK